MATIRFIEGMTCCGKTTLVKGLHEIDMRPILLEHPPRLDFDADWGAHQRRVFEDYYKAFENARGEIFADFSPFACVPFTMACMDAGYISEDEGTATVRWMTERLNVLCLHHRCHLHRYLREPLAEIERRLSTRGRLGDDQWDRDLLVAIKQRYDEFFDWGNALEFDDVGAISHVRYPLDTEATEC